MGSSCMQPILSWGVRKADDGDDDDDAPFSEFQELNWASRNYLLCSGERFHEWLSLDVSLSKTPVSIRLNGVSVSSGKRSSTGVESYSAHYDQDLDGWHGGIISCGHSLVIYLSSLALYPKVRFFTPLASLDSNVDVCLVKKKTAKNLVRLHVRSTSINTEWMFPRVFKICRNTMACQEEGMTRMLDKTPCFHLRSVHG